MKTREYAAPAVKGLKTSTAFIQDKAEFDTVYYNVRYYIDKTF